MGEKIFRENKLEFVGKLKKLHEPYLSRQKKGLKKKLELTKKERAVNTHKLYFRVSKTTFNFPEFLQLNKSKIWEKTVQQKERVR